MLVELYNGGTSIRALSERLGRTAVAVQDRLIKNHGVDWREFLDRDNSETSHTSSRQVQGSDGLSNRDLAALMREAGHPPTGQGWKVGKALRATELPITDPWIKLGLSTLKQIDPSGSTPYSDICEPLEEFLLDLATDPSATVPRRS